MIFEGPASLEGLALRVGTLGSLVCKLNRRPGSLRGPTLPSPGPLQLGGVSGAEELWRSGMPILDGVDALDVRRNGDGSTVHTDAGDTRLSQQHWSNAMSRSRSPSAWWSARWVPSA